MRKTVYIASGTIVVLLVLFFAAACTSPILVNGLPGGQIDLAVQGTAPQTAGVASFGTMALGDGLTIDVDVVASNGAALGTVTIDEALIALKDIEFELAADDEHADDEAVAEADDTGFDFNGPYVVDLIGNTITPQPDLVAVIAGRYEEVKVKLDKITAADVDGDGNPLTDTYPVLDGRSIYIQGTYSDTGGAMTDVPFTLSFDFDEEFELTGANDTSLGFVVDKDTANDIIIAFRLNKWFDFSNPETEQGVDFGDLGVVAGIDLTGDATLTATEESIREVIKENIKASADYGEDEDHDGSLGSDEDDDPDTEDADD